MSGFPNPEGNRQNPRLKTKSVCIFTWFIYVLTRSVSAFSGKKTSRLLHPIGSLIFADFCTLGFLQHKRIWISFKFLSYFLFPLFFSMKSMRFSCLALFMSQNNCSWFFILLLCDQQSPTLSYKNEPCQRSAE